MTGPTTTAPKPAAPVSWWIGSPRVGFFTEAERRHPGSNMTKAPTSFMGAWSGRKTKSLICLPDRHRGLR